MQKRTVSRILTGVFIVLILVLMWWAQGHVNPYLRRILNLIGINAIWAISFNLVYGYTGQFTLGHAGFAAIGAYVVALLTMSPAQKVQNFFIADIWSPLSHLQVPFLAALLIAGLVTALIGAIFAFPSLQFRGDYMAIVTLGLAEIVRVINMNLQTVTNGSLGLKGIPENTTLMWSAGCLIVTVLFAKQLIGTSYGRAFKAVRDDELAAGVTGISVFRHKMYAFTVSCFFAGVGGGLYAALISTIDPNLFTFLLSYQVVTVVVLGGVGSITGNLIGSALYVSLFEILRPLDQAMTIGSLTIPGFPGMRLVIFSALFMIVIIFYRRGIMGTHEFSWNWLLSKLGIWRSESLEAQK